MFSIQIVTVLLQNTLRGFTLDLDAGQQKKSRRSFLIFLLARLDRFTATFFRFFAGVGKTTTAYLVAKEFGYDVMELNASDTRSKKQLGAIVADAVNSQSLSKVSTKRVSKFEYTVGI